MGSDLENQKMGFPQDNVSVTLFILKINGTTDIIPFSFDKFRFVDNSYSSSNMASIKKNNFIVTSYTD